MQYCVLPVRPEISPLFDFRLMQAPSPASSSPPCLKKKANTEPLPPSSETKVEELWPAWWQSHPVDEYLTPKESTQVSFFKMV